MPRLKATQIGEEPDLGAEAERERADEVAVL